MKKFLVLLFACFITVVLIPPKADAVATYVPTMMIVSDDEDETKMWEQ